MNRFGAPSKVRTKRVLVDGTKLSDAGMDGIKRYVLELLRSMAAMRGRSNGLAIDVSLDGVTCLPLDAVAPHLTDARTESGLSLGTMPPAVPEKRPVRSMADLLHAAGRFHLKMQRSLQKRLRRMPSENPPHELVHVTLPSTYRVFRARPGKRLVTVHDLSHTFCPEYQTPSNRRTLAAGLDESILQRVQFLAVSHSTARELAAYAQLPLDAIPVVHEACRRDLFHAKHTGSKRAAVRQKYRIPPGPFVMTLSRIEPRKNLLGVVRAAKSLRRAHPDLRFSLVLAGGPGWGDRTELERESAGCDWIRWTGHVQESDLAALYAEAAACCCVSFYEGFCLPALEALSCGCPVIYSDRSAMPEVVSQAGLSVSPTDLDAIASAMGRLLTDERLNRTLRSQALARSEEFSWSETARRTLDLYDECLAGGAPAVARRECGAAEVDERDTAIAGFSDADARVRQPVRAA